MASASASRRGHPALPPFWAHVSEPPRYAVQRFRDPFSSSREPVRMTDTSSDFSAPGGNGADAATPPGIRILAQFIRDLSFENPNAPESLRGGVAQPQMDVGVELNAKGRDDGLFEVELKLNARAARESETVFHIELVYAGLFQIFGVAREDIEPVLMIECPRYLFPFARRMVADLSAEGGFPPFMMEPIDFGGIYAARLAQNQATAGTA